MNYKFILLKKKKKRYFKVEKENIRLIREI